MSRLLIRGGNRLQGEVTIQVVDFKTDFVQTEEDVAQHAELYRGQLAAYSLALERVLEKAVIRKALYFLQAGKTVEIS